MQPRQDVLNPRQDVDAAKTLAKMHSKNCRKWLCIAFSTIYKQL